MGNATNGEAASTRSSSTTRQHPWCPVPTQAALRHSVSEAGGPARARSAAGLPSRGRQASRPAGKEAKLGAVCAKRNKRAKRPSRHPYSQAVQVSTTRHRNTRFANRLSPQDAKAIRLRNMMTAKSCGAMKCQGLDRRGRRMATMIEQVEDLVKQPAQLEQHDVDVRSFEDLVKQPAQLEQHDVEVRSFEDLVKQPAQLEQHAVDVRSFEDLVKQPTQLAQHDVDVRSFEAGREMRMNMDALVMTPSAGDGHIEQVEVCDGEVVPASSTGGADLHTGIVFCRGSDEDILLPQHRAIEARGRRRATLCGAYIEMVEDQSDVAEPAPRGFLTFASRAVNVLQNVFSLRPAFRNAFSSQGGQQLSPAL